MRVDSNISTAITQYLKEANMAARDFAAELGVSEPAMVKWRRPGNGISHSCWMEIFPKIKKFLPKDRIYVNEAGEECYSSLLEGTGGSPYFTPKYMPQMVPVLKISELNSFQYIVQSIEQYAIYNNAERIEYRPRKKNCGSGVFAAYVDFSNSIIPEGALLFASTEVRPKEDSTILFLKRDGKVDLGKLQLAGDRYYISTSNGETICDEVNKIHDKINWIFPVLYYEVVTY